MDGDRLYCSFILGLFVALGILFGTIVFIYIDHFITVIVAFLTADPLITLFLITWLVTTILIYWGLDRL